ncbi:MAG TPA: hypothetical protein VFM93_12485 [Candidatus Limnocylindria bacterium]|nr:hypothetical protein [Candidatus Limnocylindria bacterium]
MKKDEPRPEDTLREAEAKSKSVDERTPQPGVPTPRTTESMVAGAPAAYVPQMGVGLPTGTADLEAEEGERVLEQESKGVRSHIQRG